MDSIHYYFSQNSSDCSQGSQLVGCLMLVCVRVESESGDPRIDSKAKCVGVPVSQQQPARRGKALAKCEDLKEAAKIQTKKIPNTQNLQEKTLNTHSTHFPILWRN